MENSVKTFDVIFNDDQNSNNKGFEYTYEQCLSYIARNNGTRESYFDDYKGGMVSIVCNETNECVWETKVN